MTQEIIGPAEVGVGSTGQIVPQQETAIVTPMAMLDRAITNGAGIEVLEKLFDLQRRWEENEGRKAFDRDFANAKADLPAIVKDSKVDFTTQKGRTNYEYETFAGIARAIDPVLARHGLSYRFIPEQDGNRVTVTCILSHPGGFSISAKLSADADTSGNKNAIQAVGSAVTYLQRYTLKAILGLAAGHDDDARKVGAAPTITADQYQKLTQKMEDVGADEKAFLTYFKVEELHDLRQDQYGIADGMLDERARRNAEKEKANG